MRAFPALSATLPLLAVVACSAPEAGLPRGEALFDTCVPCHGPDGGGNPDLGAPTIAVNPRVRTFQNADCPLQVYIDGVQSSDPDVNQIPPEFLDAMEVYLGATAPIQYAGLNPCGVVLLWTRR